MKIEPVRKSIFVRPTVGGDGGWGGLLQMFADSLMKDITGGFTTG